MTTDQKLECLQRQIDELVRREQESAVAVGEMLLALQEQSLLAAGKNAASFGAVLAVLLSKGFTTTREFDDFRAAFTSQADQQLAGVSNQLEDAKTRIAALGSRGEA